jgi:hypothetical protein
MQDIATWCAKYTWDQACCRCIVDYESGGNANAIHSNTDGSCDVGLWQIDTVRIILYSSTGNIVAEVLPLATP